MSAAPNTRHLKHIEVAVALGINFSEMNQLLAKDAKKYDPIFPLQVNGLFSQDEILAWEKNRNGQGAQVISSQPAIQPTQLPHDHSQNIDRGQQ